MRDEIRQSRHTAWDAPPPWPRSHNVSKHEVWPLKRSITKLLSAAIFLLGCVHSVSGQLATRVIPRPELERGFHQMYNLDFAGAHGTFHVYQKLNPDDPMGYVADGAAYLFAEFNRLQILESDLFTDDRVRDNRSSAISPVWVT